MAIQAESTCLLNGLEQFIFDACNPKLDNTKEDMIETLREIAKDHKKGALGKFYLAAADMIEEGTWG